MISGVRGPQGIMLADGSIHQTAEKDVIALRESEVRMLSWLHEFAHHNQLSVVCKRCDSAITGQNNDTPGTRSVSVACQCREWRYTL